MDKETRKKLQEQYSERRVLGGVYVIRNKSNGKMLLLNTLDMPGSLNRFNFAVQTGGCCHPKLRDEWEKDSFGIEVIEEIEKKKDQTDIEFAQDVQALFEMICEGYPKDRLY